MIDDDGIRVSSGSGSHKNESNNDGKSKNNTKTTKAAALYDDGIRVQGGGGDNDDGIRVKSSSSSYNDDGIRVRSNDNDDGIRVRSDDNDNDGIRVRSDDNDDGIRVKSNNKNHNNDGIRVKSKKNSSDDGIRIKSNNNNYDDGIRIRSVGGSGADNHDNGIRFKSSSVVENDNDDRIRVQKSSGDEEQNMNNNPYYYDDDDDDDYELSDMVMGEVNPNDKNNNNVLRGSFTNNRNNIPTNNNDDTQPTTIQTGQQDNDNNNDNVDDTYYVNVDIDDNNNNNKNSNNIFTKIPLIRDIQGKNTNESHDNLENDIEQPSSPQNNNNNITNNNNNNTQNNDVVSFETVNIYDTGDNINNNNNKRKESSDDDGTGVKKYCILCCNDFGKRLVRVFMTEKRLLLSFILLLVVLNVPYIKFIMYPFMIFSTWVHEMCHGIAALLIGGKIASLHVYTNGSGLAYTSIPGGNGMNSRRVFVASAGYTGTAVWGSILLLFRNQNKRIFHKWGTFIIGCCMIISVIAFVRNAFGIIIILIMGIILCLCSFFLPVLFLAYLYTFLALTCCFNAFTSIQTLLKANADDSFIVGNEVTTNSSDAHTVANILGLPYYFWAFLWLLFSIIMSTLGLVYGAKPSTNNTSNNNTNNTITNMNTNTNNNNNNK